MQLFGKKPKDMHETLEVKIMKKSEKKCPASKKQGYNDKLDESLGMRMGKESTKKQSYKSRRDESKGAKKKV